MAAIENKSWSNLPYFAKHRQFWKCFNHYKDETACRNVYMNYSRETFLIFLKKAYDIKEAIEERKEYLSCMYIYVQIPTAF